MWRSASGSDLEGQTKTKLASADATKAVFSVTRDELQLYFDRNLGGIEGDRRLRGEIRKDPEGRGTRQDQYADEIPFFL